MLTRNRERCVGGSVRDEDQMHDSAGGSSGSGLKRKAEDMPEEEQQRCVEKDPEEDVVIGCVEVKDDGDGKAIKVMHLNDVMEMDCIRNRNDLLHKIESTSPDVVVVDVGEIVAGSKNFLGVVYKM